MEHSDHTEPHVRSVATRDAGTLLTFAVVAMVLLLGVGISPWTIALVGAMAVVSIVDTVQRHMALRRAPARSGWRIEVTPLVRIVRGRAS
jgi:hypothetical protein